MTEAAGIVSAAVCSVQVAPSYHRTTPTPLGVGVPPRLGLGHARDYRRSHGARGAGFAQQTRARERGLSLTCHNREEPLGSRGSYPAEL